MPAGGPSKPANARPPAGRRPGANPGPTVRVRMGEGFDASSAVAPVHGCGGRAVVVAVPRPGGHPRGTMRDDEAMELALAAGAAARRRTAPNPWVGCVLV